MACTLVHMYRPSPSCSWSWGANRETRDFWPQIQRRRPHPQFLCWKVSVSNYVLINVFIFYSSSWIYFACHSIGLHLCVGLWMSWTGLPEEEVQEGTRSPRARISKIQWWIWPEGKERVWETQRQWTERELTHYCHVNSKLRLYETRFDIGPKLYIVKSPLFI